MKRFPTQSAPQSPLHRRSPAILNSNSFFSEEISPRTMNHCMQKAEYEMNNGMKQITHQLQAELAQQRLYSEKLNNNYNKLREKYDIDVEKFLKKVQLLSNEKFELTKDLDLALERDANNKKFFAILEEQITENKISKECHLQTTSNLTDIKSDMKSLLDNVKQQSVENMDKYQKIKLVFEDTAMQLQKYHESQTMVEKLRQKMEIYHQQQMFSDMLFSIHFFIKCFAQETI